MPGGSTGIAEGPTDPVLRDVVTSQELHVGTVADLGILGDVWSSGLIIPVAAAGQGDVCFLRADPGAREALRATLPALLATPNSTSPTVVADRLSASRFTQDFVRDYRQRPQRSVAWPAGAVIGLVWLLLRWTRRSHDALYATLGATASRRAAIHLSEWLTSLAVSAVVALVAAGWFALMVGTPGWVAWPHLARSVVVAAATATVVVLGWELVPLRSPLASLRDR